MKVLIINTHNIQHTIKNKEPYKSFLQKYAAVEDEDMETKDICINLGGNKAAADNVFCIDEFYFSNPLCRFSYFNVRDQEKAIDKYLIHHTVDFEFRADNLDAVAAELLDIKRKQQYLYLPEVEEIEILYNIEYGKAVLEINTVISKKESLKQVSMSLISLDIALLAKRW